MNVSRSRKLATRELLKSSDKKKLSVDAKVIVALIKRQPQKRLDLCKSAGIHPSSFNRVRRLLENRGIMEETDNGYKLWFYSEPTSSWDHLQHDFEQVGANLVEAAIERAYYAGRDSVTGWRTFKYKPKEFIKGIIVLKGAIRLVATARSAGIYIHEEYDGVVLSSDLIRWKDRLWWEGKLYEVREVEDRLDVYNLVGYRIGKLVELPVAKEHGKASSPDRIIDARKQIRTFLTAGLNDDNITRDDGSKKAPFCVIYTDPPYPIIKEFQASNSPADGLYAVGAPESVPLLGHDQTPYGYEERVPIFIFTIDKVGVSGSKLRWMMEVELKRVCETYRIGSLQTLKSWADNTKRLKNTILYSAEFVFSYKHARET